MQNIYLSEDVIHIQNDEGVFTTLFIGKEKALLLDTGYGLESLKKHVCSITSLPLIVVNSHCHFNHVLGNAEFSMTYMHKKDIPFYEYYTSVPLRKRIYAKFTEQGRNVHISEEEYLRREYPDPYPFENEEWDLGGICLKSIWLPGHTRGSIALIDEKRKRIYLGDAANQRTLLYLPGAASVQSYKESLHMLLKIDFNDMVFAHNRCIYPREDIRAILNCICRYQRKKSSDFYIDEIPGKRGRYFQYGCMSCGDEIAVVCPDEEGKNEEN